jgi:RNA polymerase sigma factor (sigma-70 family)
MILGVCRRVLRDQHEAEDAFQAVFLVFIRKAASIVPREMVGNWLYGVAYQTAVRARSAAAKRRGREKQVIDMPESAIIPQQVSDDLEPLLDQELSRLPEKYRVPIVLCDLEGKSRRDVASQLGWPEGTLSGRLSRGRAMLANRLSRRGVVISAGLIASALSRSSASAGIPTPLAVSTVKLATAVALGRAATAGMVSAKVVALSEGVLKMMSLTKLKVTTVVLLLAFLACVATTALTRAGWAAVQPEDAAATVEAGDKPAIGDGATPAALPPAPRPGSALLLVEHASPVTCLAWSFDGKLIAAGTKDGTVYLTEVATGKVLRSIPTKGTVTWIAFSPDGKSLAVCQPQGTVSLWDAATGQPHQMNGGSSTVPEKVAFMSDSQTVVGVGRGQFMQVGPFGGGGMMMGNAAGGGCTAIALDGSVSGWCNPDGRLHLRSSDQTNQRGFGRAESLSVGSTKCIALASGGKLLAVAEDKAVQLWDLSATKKTTRLAGLEKPLTELSFSNDGQTLVGLMDGSTIRVWELARGATRSEITHNRGKVQSLALSPDGTMLATTAVDGKGIFLWTTAARRLSHTGPPVELSPPALAAIWGDLASSQRDKADAAWEKLGAAGDTAVPFIAEKIRAIAVPAIDIKKIEKAMADLDADKFAVRERASKDLIAMGELAVIPIRRFLEKGPSQEATSRAHQILEKIAQPTPSPDHQRVMEIIDLLEQSRTPKAIALLQEIDRDALVPRIQSQAHGALQRIMQFKKSGDEGNPKK